MLKHKQISNVHTLYVNDCIESNDTSIFIRPDPEDLSLIIKELNDSINKSLPSQNIFVTTKQKNQVLIFILNKIVDTIDSDGNLLKIEVILNQIYINKVINNLITNETRKYILNKYAFQTINYENDLIKLIDSSIVYNKIKNDNRKNKPQLEYHKNAVFSCSLFESNSTGFGLGKFKYFKQYVFNYKFVTHSDFEKIKKMVKKVNSL